MSWKNSKNIIVLLYNPYSCGKFVSNILSYNQKFVPQFPFNVDRPKWYSKETYDAMTLDQLMSIKHETVMKTIPPSKKDCQDWLNYELGCDGFWGFSDADIPDVSITSKTEWLLEQHINCFLMLHNHNDLTKVTDFLPNCQVVKIINDQDINALSRSLKNKKYQRGIMDLSQLNFLKSTIDFDIGSIFNKTQFFLNIKKLLNELEVEDTSLNPEVDQYYQMYCNLYQ